MVQKFLLWAAFVLITISKTTSQSSTINRPYDPVVLQGSQLVALQGFNPSLIVAFKFAEGSWQQIPMQIDEKALLDLVTPYGPYAAEKGFPPPTGVNHVFYTDANTYTGADPDPLFDAGDELVLMVKDAGAEAIATIHPAGVVAGTGQQLVINDPLGGTGYIYLFQQDGTLRQDAGVSYVTYDFQLTNGGTYLQNFVFLNARNNENTTITTSNYSWHFAAEWISDELKIKTGGSANVDILDRHKSFFANGNCQRSENTFSDGDNAFATNKSGPIRAIRSYMGANSGPFTQRTNVFYQGRQDIITNLRVHNIASINDAFDYNTNINGGKYRNNLNTIGVIINGAKDVVTLGDITWEMVSSSKGSLVMLNSRITDLTVDDATFSSYYDDNKTKAASNCSGDVQAWGTSGVSVKFNNGTVCTEPLKSNCATSTWFRKLEVNKVIYFEAPNTPISTATNYQSQKSNPLLVQVSAYNTPVTQAMQTGAKPSIAESGNNLGNNRLLVFPNPSNDVAITRYFSNKQLNAQVLLINLAGRIVRKINVNAKEGWNSFSIETGSLPAGLYLLQVIDGKNLTSTKLIVQ